MVHGAVRRRRSPYGTVHAQRLPGIVLILVGGIFLAQNYFGATLHTWWALFVAGFGLLILTAVFRLDLPIGRLWPAFLIVAGVALSSAAAAGAGRASRPPHRASHTPSTRVTPSARGSR
jgi:hypothetical protein